MSDIRSESKSEAIESLLKAQSEMEKAVKSSNNPYFKSKYADLETVVNATMKAFWKNGFAVIQPSGRDDRGHFVDTKLIHKSGESFESRIYLEIAKNDMQSLGSSQTYARRYGLMAMACIAPEDDDGNAASGKINSSSPQSQQSQNNDRKIEKKSSEVDKKEVSINDDVITKMKKFYVDCNSDQFLNAEEKFKSFIEKISLSHPEKSSEIKEIHDQRMKDLNIEKLVDKKNHHNIR